MTHLPRWIVGGFGITAVVVAINATVGKNIGAGAVILAVIGTISLLGAVLLVNLALFGVMFPQTAHRIQHAWMVHHYGRTPARRVAPPGPVRRGQLRSPEEIHRILDHEPKVVPEMTTQTVPQGWYHDSGDPEIVRWWDGTRWTSLTKRTGAAAPPPSPGGI